MLQSMAARKRKAKRSADAPWKHDAPATASHHKLTPAKRAAAKRRAKKAGRPYPNLVDNMQAAKGSKRKKAKSKRAK
jgi:hypothetical protein